MADKIDKLFKSYYQHEIENKIADRKQDIKNSAKPDENVGGGRLQNVNSNPVENYLIKVERDLMIRHWRRQIKSIREYVATLTKENQEMLVMHYSKPPLKKSWQQISMKMYLDQTTCKKRLAKIKQEYRKSFFCV
ncbi:RinA family protein [Convivina intestini]|uniref:RinA family protein n=1 Tax=Convivina intestini TaxID=1505726 RepID=UPI00200BFF98|nr:RinA family protein [Convivina intestini]CAH1853793.1 hypothetical protein R078131_00838 [Convivina intestini]